MFFKFAKLNMVQVQIKVKKSDKEKGERLCNANSSSCYILTFDPAQKCYSKVMHRKEVTHSNGQ